MLGTEPGQLHAKKAPYLEYYNSGLITLFFTLIVCKGDIPGETPVMFHHCGLLGGWGTPSGLQGLLMTLCSVITLVRSWGIAWDSREQVGRIQGKHPIYYTLSRPSLLISYSLFT